MKAEFFWDNFLLEGAECESIVLLSLLVVTMIVQLCYYLIHYGRIKSHRNPSAPEQPSVEGVSVVIPLYDADHGFLNERLPLFLSQKMQNYEVVVVDVTGDVEVSEQLSLMRITSSERLTTTRLTADKHMPILTKMALNVGIKAARYENIIFTLPDCMPRSERWAEMMARGFVGHDVVLGYAALSHAKGLVGRLLRCANMALSVRWLASAVGRHPYRGTLCNMGFKKSLYLAARGFNHLNINMGEDDLFVMTIANKDNTVATMGGSSTIDFRAWGGLRWWFKRRLRLSYPYRFYPARVKWTTGVELWSRELFFLAAIGVALFLPLYAKVAAGVVALLRYVLVWWQMKRLSRRLSERGFLSMYWLYDLMAPTVEAVLAVRRRMIPKYKWR